MERELIAKFYDEYKTLTSEIIGVIEKQDISILKNIQIFVQKDKKILTESAIEGLWDEYKRIISKPTELSDPMNKNKNINIKSKILESYFNFLLDMFKDEFKLDHFHLNNVFKGINKELATSLIAMKKSQSIKPTEEMTSNTVLIYFIFPK